MKRYLLVILLSCSALFSMEKSVDKSMHTMALMNNVIDMNAAAAQFCGLYAGWLTTNKALSVSEIVKSFIDVIIDNVTLNRVQVNQNGITLDDLFDLDELKLFLKKANNLYFHPKGMPVRKLLISYVNAFKDAIKLDIAQGLIDPAAHVDFDQVFEQILKALKNDKVDSIKKIVNMELLSKNLPLVSKIYNFEFLCTVLDKALQEKQVNYALLMYALVLHPFFRVLNENVITSADASTNPVLFFFLNMFDLRSRVNQYVNLAGLTTFLQKLENDAPFKKEELLACVTFSCGGTVEENHQFNTKVGELLSIIIDRAIHKKSFLAGFLTESAQSSNAKK